MSRILFSDGVIQFRTGVQIIPEASAVDDCVCCECLCPDESIQKKIVSAVFAISDIVDSYAEEQLSSGTLYRSLEINGLSSFNGSYNAIFGEPPGMTSMPNPCEADDSGCPLDDPKQTACEWRITIPDIEITGTYAQNGFSTTFSGYARLGFGLDGRPQIGVQANFATPIPFSLQDSLRCGFYPGGVQSFHQVTGGFLFEIYRFDCTSTDRLGFHGPIGPNLDLIVNGSQSIWQSGTTYIAGESVLVARFATCGGTSNTIFYTTNFSGTQVSPTSVANGSVSVPSCSGVNEGTCDGFDATYSLTVVTT